MSLEQWVLGSDLSAKRGAKRVPRTFVQRRELNLDDLLTREGSWEEVADVRPLEGILRLELTGGFLERSWQAKDLLCEQLGLAVPTPPFVQLLVRLLAFRSLEQGRYTRPSDLLDLVMAATVGPYVDVLASDRYLREVMERVGYRGRVYSGRRHEVQQLATDLAEQLSSRYRDSGSLGNAR
jgi:hypothetical protein